MVKKVMIAGFGKHGRGSWYHSIKKHPDWELTGIIDTDLALLEQIPEMNLGLGEDQVFRNLEEVVKFGDKPDMVILATPIPTHHVMFKEAMDYGINVITEKNLASTIYQGRQMVQACLDHPDLVSAVGVQRRYAPAYWAAKKYLASDANQIGQLCHIRWYDAFNWGSGNYRADWRQYLPELFAEDQMVHWYDLMRYITGMDIVQVKADSFIPNFSNWQGSSAIMAQLALAHPDDYNHRHNWTWVMFYGDWQRRGSPLSVNEFSGEKGRFVIDHQWGLKLEVYTNEGGSQWEEDGYLPGDAGSILDLGTKFEGQGIILEMMKRGIDSKGKTQPNNNVIDVFKSFAAVMGAIESSRSGKAVWVPDYWKDLPI
jgi:predicted dehydrogenase